MPDALTREELIAAATVLHDEECRSCDRKYRMSCPNMARAILRAGPVARAVAAERGRIRSAAEALKFTLFRPGNGPAQAQALDVVPLADLPGLLKGGSDDD